MSQETITKCDFCGAVKGKNNHWWKLGIAGIGSPSQPCPPLLLGGPNSGVAGKDACGEACVSKGVQRFLATGSLEENVEKGGKAQ